ncbi:MAG: VWA domain-containing protein [Candidatus Heimdallarchaeota archaeon]
MKQRNIPAIEVLSEVYPRTLVNLLPLDTDHLDLILESSSLVFQLRPYYSYEERQVLLRKLIPRLYRQAMRIFKEIDRNRYPETSPYSPGRPWNVEKTLENYLQSGDLYFTYKHVVSIRRLRRHYPVVLLIDKSHSVLQHLRLIILTSILFSLSTDLNNLAIIGFDSLPDILKGFRDSWMTPTEMIRRLIELASGGKTNIFLAVQAAMKELETQISSHKTLILMSDLLATSGKNFIPLLAKVKDVRIIITPRKHLFQLTKPIIGQLRRFGNIRLYYMPVEAQEIPLMLEKVLFS